MAGTGATALVLAGVFAFVSMPYSEAAASGLPPRRLAGISTTAAKVASVSRAQSPEGATARKAPLAKSVKKRATKRATVRKVKRTSTAVVSHAPWKSARASWYGPGFYGHTMAGGGKLQRNSMIVAHKTLPFGTKVQISYRGRTVVAEVRDRGPYVHGRQFDLGPGTARSLRFGGVGTIRYRVLKRG